MASARSQRIAAIQTEKSLIDNKLAGFDYLRDYAGKAIDALGSGTGAARTDITTGYGDASAALGAGSNQAQATLGQVQGLYQPYQDAGVRATNALEGSLYGDNSQFKASDNYNFTRDEALKAAQRQAAATGRLDSGGLLTELGRVSSGLASAEINNWQNRLAGLGQQGMQAASGIAGGLTNLGNVQYQTGAGQAQLNAARGNALGTLGANQGSQAAGIYSNLGNSLVNLGTQTAMQVANGYSQAAQASDAARSANQNLMLGIGGQILGLGLGGGSTVGGSLLGGLSSGISSIRNIGTGGLNYY